MSRIIGVDLASDHPTPELIQMLKISCMILTAEKAGRMKETLDP